MPTPRAVEHAAGAPTALGVALCGERFADQHETAEKLCALVAGVLGVDPDGADP